MYVESKLIEVSRKIDKYDTHKALMRINNKNKSGGSDYCFVDTDSYCASCHICND